MKPAAAKWSDARSAILLSNRFKYLQNETSGRMESLRRSAEVALEHGRNAFVEGRGVGFP
jgi:hypothetical protein